MRAVILGCLIAVLLAPAAEARLKAFGSCARLSSYARAHFEQTPPVREIVPVAAPVEDDHSSTNVQEDGVDEPDMVKTDGRRLFAVAGGALHAIDVRSRAPRRLGSLALPEGGGHELLLHGDRVLVLTQLGGVGIEPVLIREPFWRPRTLLSEVDVSDPARMRVVRTLEAAGAYVSARSRGATARVVIASVPTDGAVRPRGTLTRANGSKSVRRLVRCRAVRRPTAFSGLELVTVLTIDLARGLPAVDSDAVMARADTVYASHRSLFVATHRWTGAVATEIHRFDASEARRTAYGSTGSVRGSLLSQWALSEHEGHLRVASTDDAESHVTVLRERDRRLVEVGSVGGLGRGERIFGVRFIGDVGYVVTFRQTDPLYTIALENPERPRVLGELKLLGYSAYLHPLGDGLLLGVGQDATEAGRRLGTQLSLFDVSDPRAPRRLHQRTLGGSGTVVEWDHHAFLHWRGLTVIPVDSAANGFRVGRGGIEPAGAVSQPGSISRSVVAAGRLLTVSEAGVASSSLATLSSGAWLPFQEGAP